MLATRTNEKLAILRGPAALLILLRNWASFLVLVHLDGGKEMIMEKFTSIERLVQETKKCLEMGLTYPALFMAMVIPDACGSDKFPELQGNSHSKERFVKWFHSYVDPIYNMISFYYGKKDDTPEMNGETTYCLRCSLFHEAKLELGEKARVDEFVIDSTRSGMGFISQSGTDLRWNGKEYAKVRYIYVRVYPLIQFIVEGAENYLREKTRACPQ